MDQSFYDNGSLESCLEQLEKVFTDSGLYFGHGTDSAWDEAVQLACFVLGVSPNADQSILSRQLTASELHRIGELADKRIQTRMPLPYLTRLAWFMGMPFYIDERALIPRSPFAELIAHSFQPWIKLESIRRVLEIGTGSGCMAIAVATQFSDVEVVATDVDTDALCVARKNVQRYNLEHRIQLCESNMFAHVEGLFDVIISNPPYVNEQEMQSLPLEYQHEPYHALHAEKRGMKWIDILLAQASRYLHPHGILIVEVGSSEQEVARCYPKLPLTWIQFEFGGHGVFVISQKELLAYRNEP